MKNVQVTVLSAVTAAVAVFHSVGISQQEKMQVLTGKAYLSSKYTSWQLKGSFLYQHMVLVQKVITRLVGEPQFFSENTSNEWFWPHT